MIAPGLWLARALARRLRCIEITDAGRPYMIRHFVCPIPRWVPGLGGGRVLLQRFVASDPGRGLHNHPWRWSFGFLLSGRYTDTRLRRITAEGLEWACRFHGPGGLNVIGPGTWHRLDLDTPEVWTVFVHGPKCREWGFLNPLPPAEAPYRGPDGRAQEWALGFRFPVHPSPTDWESRAPRGQSDTLAAGGRH